VQPPLAQLLQQPVAALLAALWSAPGHHHQCCHDMCGWAARLQCSLLLLCGNTAMRHVLV
jgi:hypothetical protein